MPPSLAQLNKFSQVRVSKRLSFGLGCACSNKSKKQPRGNGFILLMLAFLVVFSSSVFGEKGVAGELAGGNIGASPTGVYGLKKLIAAYSGAALRVVRAADQAEQDVGFLGDHLDTASALAFGGKSPLKVAVLYDQSGHGNHLTQTVAASQPPLYLEGGEPAILFRGKHALNIPKTLTADRADVSMFAVTRDVSSYVTSGCFYMGSAATGKEMDVDLGLMGFVNCFGSMPVWDARGRKVEPSDGSTVGTATTAIVGIVSGPGGVTVHRDGKTATTGADMPTPKKMTAGGQYGRTPNVPGRQDMLAWVFYPKALTGPEATEVKAVLKKAFPTNSWTPSLNVAFQGDSKTYGVDTPRNLTLPRLVSLELPGAVVRNMGIGGHEIKGDKSRFSIGNNFTEPGAMNVMVLYEGTNDLNNPKPPATAEEIWGYYQTFAAHCRAHGWNRILCCTITPRGITEKGFTAEKEAQRRLLNQMIRENKGRIFDGIVDFGTIAALGSDTKPNTAYLPDGLHENEAAYMLEAPLVAAAIKAAATSPQPVTPALPGSKP